MTALFLLFHRSACYVTIFLKKNRHNAHPTHTPARRGENTRYSFTPWIRCTTTTSHPTMPSYKASVWNKTKLPHPPHRDTMVNIWVSEWCRIRPGDGAVASFYGVHIQGKIRSVGGLYILAKLQCAGRIGPSILVEKINHTIINRWVTRRSTNWPWYGKAAMFGAMNNRGNIGCLGGRGKA